MNSQQNPRPARERFDTLGGSDPGEREDELAVADVTEPVSGADTLGGPDTGPEDELAVPDAGESRDTSADADSGERPEG